MKEIEVDIDANIFRRAFPDGGKARHALSRQLFEEWHRDMITDLRVFCRKKGEGEIDDALVHLIHDMQWLAWNASPPLVAPEEKDALFLEGMKLLKEENGQLKADNQKLRHTIDNVLSDGEKA